MGAEVRDVSENGAFLQSENGGFIQSQNGARGGGAVPLPGGFYVAWRGTKTVDLPAEPGGAPVTTTEQQAIIIQRYSTTTGAFEETVARWDAPFIYADDTQFPIGVQPMTLELKGMARIGGSLGLLYTHYTGQFTDPGGVRKQWIFRTTGGAGDVLLDIAAGGSDPANRPEYINAGLHDGGECYVIGEFLGTTDAQLLYRGGPAPSVPYTGTDYWDGGVALTDQDGLGGSGVRYLLGRSTGHSTLARRGTATWTEFTLDIDGAVYCYNTYPSSPKIWGMDQDSISTQFRGFDLQGTQVVASSGAPGPGFLPYNTGVQQFGAADARHYYAVNQQLWGLETTSGGGLAILFQNVVPTNDTGDLILLATMTDNFAVVREVFNL